VHDAPAVVDDGRTGRQEGQPAKEGAERALSEDDAREARRRREARFEGIDRSRVPRVRGRRRDRLVGAGGRDKEQNRQDEREEGATCPPRRPTGRTWGLEAYSRQRC